MAVASYFDTVQKLYIAFYQRPADPSGLYFWAQRLEAAGGSLEGVIDAFANAAEAVRLYDTNGDQKIDNADASKLLDSVYLALFNRAPDANGKQFYLDALTAGKFPDGRPATVGRVVLDVLNGATNSDAVAVANKLEYATAFTKALDPELDGIGPFQATYDSADELGARSLLAGVTSDPTTRKTAGQVAADVQTKIANPGDPILGQQTDGQVFTLTNNQDISGSLIGSAGTTSTNGGDTFNANPYFGGGFSGVSTLQTYDSIDGGKGIDTLNIFVGEDIGGSGGGNSEQVGTIKNIELVNIYNSEVKNGNVFGGTGIDAAKFQGATLINQIDGYTSVSNLAEGATAQFTGAPIGSGVSNLAEGATAQFTGAPIGSGATTVSTTFTGVTANVVLSNVVDGFRVNVEGAKVTTVNLSGSVKPTTGQTVAQLKLGGQETGSPTGSLADLTTVNLSLTSNTELNVFTPALATVTTIDGSASTGGLTMDLSNATDDAEQLALATLKTGSGKDVITLNQNNLKAAAITVTTGAGDDKVTVNAASLSSTAKATALNIDTGEGKDTISVAKVAGNKLNIAAGAGDDVVTLTDGVLATTDVVDGGDGIDTIGVAGAAARTDDDDFIVFNSLLKNFETLQFTSAEGASGDGSGLNLDKLAARYTTVEFAAGTGGSGSFVENVGTQKLVAKGDLTATAKGYVPESKDTKTVYAGSLNITSKGSPVTVTANAEVTVTANAETLALTVDASKAAATTTLEGFVKTAAVTLVTGTNDQGTATTTDDALFAAAFNLTTSATVDTDLTSLTSLTLSGNGAATVVNADGTKLVSVDASGLNSADIKGKAVAGLEYTSNNALAETIKLGAGLDNVVLNASTYGAVNAKTFDTVEGLKLVLNAAGTALDEAKSDIITVGTPKDFVKFTTTQTDLDLALKDAAASSIDHLVFQMGGNTYIYGDVGTTGSVDGADVLVKLVGAVDLDALVIALGVTPTP